MDVLNGLTTGSVTGGLINGVFIAPELIPNPGSYTIEASFDGSSDVLASSGNVFETISV